MKLLVLLVVLPALCLGVEGGVLDESCKLFNQLGDTFTNICDPDDPATLGVRDVCEVNLCAALNAVTPGVDVALVEEAIDFFGKACECAANLLDTDGNDFVEQIRSMTETIAGDVADEGPVVAMVNAFCGGVGEILVPKLLEDCKDLVTYQDSRKCSVHEAMYPGKRNKKSLYYELAEIAMIRSPDSPPENGFKTWTELGCHLIGCGVSGASSCESIARFFIDPDTGLITGAADNLIDAAKGYLNEVLNPSKTLDSAKVLEVNLPNVLKAAEACQQDISTDIPDLNALVDDLSILNKEDVKEALMFLFDAGSESLYKEALIVVEAIDKIIKAVEEGNAMLDGITASNPAERLKIFIELLEEKAEALLQEGGPPMTPKGIIGWLFGDFLDTLREHQGRRGNSEKLVPRCRRAAPAHQHSP
uniref:Secreted protein n=1 Tax=Vitrella brassicaformis TaxID=1169539 RepID=A0A7S1KAW0_9ALVE|mmetsp:Transcript_43552/g.108740  ORF Transcript_43552/g.108740 Transcript_43552/m.108740 type:complete len:419 (+) Transcript_43552:40-1296(+)